VTDPRLIQPISERLATLIQNSHRLINWSKRLQDEHEAALHLAQQELSRSQELLARSADPATQSAEICSTAFCKPITRK
jgi:hypothetical protein